MPIRFVMTTLVMAMVALPSSALGKDQLLQDLRSKLREGDRVRIVDITRSVTDGRLDSLAAGSVLLKVRGKTVDIPNNRVFLVQVPRREGDGVLIGMGIGAAAGLTLAWVDCRDSSEHTDCVRAASVIYGGSMAIVGALFDRGFRRYTTVFDRTAPGDTVRIAPLLGARRKGLALTISF